MAAAAASPYKKSRMHAVAVDATPSLLYNNLTTNGNRVAFVHKTRVVAFNESACEGKVDVDCSAIKCPTVVQVKWVDVGEDLLVVCRTGGITVYKPKDASSADLETAFSSDFVDEMTSTEGQSKFARGAVGTSHGELIVGTFSGALAVFKGAELEKALLEGHTHPIVCLSASKRYFVSGDQFGTVMLWHNDRTRAGTFIGNGFPCTSVATRGERVFAGFASGHVRVFDTTSKSPAVEISAHVRSVLGIALHPTLPLLATAGEDTVLNLFNIPEEGDVTVPFSTVVTDRVLTGVQFSGRRSDLMVCAYDSHSVSVWLTV